MKSVYSYRMAVMALLVLLHVVLPWSCRREPIYEQADHIRLTFDFDLSENDTAMWVKPRYPKLMKVVFYDTDTRARVAEMYCGPSGTSVYGLLPGGKYDMIAYNYDVSNTFIDHEENFNSILAYSKVMSGAGGSYISEPEHLLVGRKTDIVIPYLTDEDTTYVINTGVSTIMDSYSIQIDSIKGLQNASAVDLYLTGHSRSNNIGPNLRSDVSTTLYIGSCRPDPTYTYLYTTFCTFGKISGEPGVARVRLVVTGAGGRVYEFEQDITEQYSSPSHRLVLSIKGEIKPREQGGFTPDVDEWDADITDIVLD